MRLQKKALMDQQNLDYAATLIEKLLEITECTSYYRIMVDQKNSAVIVRESTTNIPVEQAQTGIEKFKNAMQNLNDNKCMTVLNIILTAKPDNKEIHAMKIANIDKKQLNDFLKIKRGIDNVSEKVWEDLCTKHQNSMRP